MKEKQNIPNFPRKFCPNVVKHKEKTLDGFILKLLPSESLIKVKILFFSFSTDFSILPDGSIR